MAQQALPDRLPDREAKLGRPLGDSRSVQGVVLLLPGGAEHSVRRRSPLAAMAALRLARQLARAGQDESLVTHLLHYRFQGWNGDAEHPVADTRWAVEEVLRRYGDVPVCLIGTDVGARAALRAAGHPAVTAVLALAPWLPLPHVRPGAGADGADSDRAEAGGAEAGVRPVVEPVRQLAGRQVLIVHGTDDEYSDPELSFRLAERAKKINPRVCRFEVHSDGHRLRQHRDEVAALAADFVLGTLGGRDFARPLADAMAAPPPLGLRMPLAAGFGRTLSR
ncbi:alpha/beta hydrolase [Streptomyces sp. N2-109]|uniref:Alpha/beta hydrolase n=1 Tax=Streptomyces gossypii TaxID=2883101 RepID=A0ABT2K2R7_9ACTN|nr:alpha/beta hydrolase [Streptomyces gossypii]MCT2594462.1 alpha/beta hydrolase [Streptomyces gossypii]